MSWEGKMETWNMCLPLFITSSLMKSEHMFYVNSYTTNQQKKPITNLNESLTGSNILLWRRGSSVVTASNLMITRDQRFRLLDEYSLQIKGVRPQDAGDYICQIGDQENRDLVHTVEILVPPTVRAHPETGHVTARKGSTVTLECKASGNPVPSISWVKRVRKSRLAI